MTEEAQQQPNTETTQHYSKTFYVFFFIVFVSGFIALMVYLYRKYRKVQEREKMEESIKERAKMTIDYYNKVREESLNVSTLEDELPETTNIERIQGKKSVNDINKQLRKTREELGKEPSSNKNVEADFEDLRRDVQKEDKPEKKKENTEPMEIVE